MVFSATFNSISVTLWRSVLLVYETVGLGENHRPVASCFSILKQIDNVFSYNPVTGVKLIVITGKFKEDNRNSINYNI